MRLNSIQRPAAMWRPFGGRWCGALVAILLGFLLMNIPALRGDPVIPANILDPKTAPEAWNVIRLATQNAARLMDEKRISEVPVQISYCSPALRTLARLASGTEAITRVGSQTRQAFTWINAVGREAKANDLAATKSALANLQTVLDGIARHFEPAVVAAEIFSCPMHPEVISQSTENPCGRCGVRLLARRIPYSFVYTRPGEPTIRMTARANTPVQAGKKIDVTVRLEKADKSPVLPGDLFEMHTERIHLLIEEPGLGDYHHEHPVPTRTPGEYSFSFTPAKSAPYRLWADLVPLATGMQELPFVDLPSAETAPSQIALENRHVSSAGGFRFALSFAGGARIPLTAGQIHGMVISISDANGQPVMNLEPLMNAFAHVVGFYGDYQTVVHLHPRGGEILNPAFRGGPALAFDFFPPKEGFIRLYCQVRINGQSIIAPLGLNVEPYCAPPGNR